MKHWEKTSKKHRYLGTMAAESNDRGMRFVKHGCNAYDMKRPQSRPLGHWLEDDIWDYIAAFAIPLPKDLYDKHGYTRTGCMWCAFGAHMEEGENRFQKLQKSHPKIHNYCMTKLGLKEVLEFVGVNPYRDSYEIDYFKQFEDKK
jgi:3'-phosphoadenosine 5'-phosphosulfate sulfotransferase (PAPS reductase)/FAD synthetase